ncbi:LAFA_0D14510g1_1 [Lachancea sp. 'fantastica']|nr:LAFA_0D14510g1_1 [Lachancea sp. 'fantastica']
MAESLASSLKGLSLQDHGTEWEINCKRFQHVHPSQFSPQPLPFFTDVKELGGLTQKLDEEKFVLDSCEGLAHLKDDVSRFVKDGDRSCISNYLGHDMLENYETYSPVSPDQLEDMRGVKQFIDHRYSVKKNRSKFTIVCSRHNMIDLIMAPFSDQDVHLNAINHDSYLYLFPDKQSGDELGGIHSDDSRIRKICYTGFELEHLVTKAKDPSVSSAFYSIVCGQIDDGLECLFKAEMDAVEPSSSTYTEIKCSTGLKTNSSYNRRKMLRMWVQTSLIPSTTLLFGLRDPYYNQLASFERYTRTQLYRKFNNSNLKFSPQKYNYNANISVQWFRHIFKAIQRLVEAHLPPDTPDARLHTSFKLTLTKSLVLKLQKLNKMPPNTVF